MYSNIDRGLRGTQRRKGQHNQYLARRYDLEIDEQPIRNFYQARQLLEINKYCYEVTHAIAQLKRDVFSSTDGDDRGWRMAETIDDTKTRVHPDVKAIGDRVATRKQGGEYVLGGDRLKKGLGQFFGLGDSFLQLSIEKEGIGRNDYVVAKTLYMPVFEMFRLESDIGELEQFEQREQLNDRNPTVFEPPSIVHMRYNTKHLYGESPYIAAIDGYDAWTRVKDIAADICDAVRQAAIKPLVHTADRTVTETANKEYKADIEQQRREQIMMDLFLKPGRDVKELAGNNQNLDFLIDSFLQFRYLLLIPGFPTYFFPGLDARQKGAKEIAGAPALNYQRLIYDLRSIATKGITQVIDTEIILAKGWEFYYEHGRNYRIEWAKWDAIAFQGNEKKDEDKSNKEPDNTNNESNYVLNGHSN